MAHGMYLSKGVCLDKFKEKLFYNNKMRKLNMCVGVIRVVLGRMGSIQLTLLTH